MQEADGQSLIVQLLGAQDINQAWTDVAANVQAQDAVENQAQELQTQKSTLASSQSASQQKQQTLTSQQQTLTSQQQTLAATVQSKNQLLVETDAKETTYEKLLAAAQAQLASFSAFTQNAGGSKLLGNQTVCDSWGCYYNQRDTAWGNDALNGTKYTLASDGCLVTALAMVMTHYGYSNVTPVTINSNPGNFAAYYPAYLLATINVDGASVTRTTAAIDATLSTGNPVIVGLNAYGGTHYVVLVSGSKGNYIMRDPYITNGKDISFSANYLPARHLWRDQGHDQQLGTLAVVDGAMRAIVRTGYDPCVVFFYLRRTRAGRSAGRTTRTIRSSCQGMTNTRYEACAAGSLPWSMDSWIR